MTELEVLQNIAQKANTIDFYFGVISGIILGFVFWNLVKEAAKD